MRQLTPWIELNHWQGEGLLSVLGPTGSGKTSAVLHWVRKKFPHALRTPLLVSVDAVAVWKGLDLGSAKPIGVERSEFDWIGLDFLDASQPSTVTSFVNEVSPRIEDALRQLRPVICVGGSHFYERALLEGQAPGAASDAEFQKSLESLSNAELSRRLKKCDARFASKIHENDRYRLSRFLDLAERQKLTFDALFEFPPQGLLKNFSHQIQRCVMGLDQDVEALKASMQHRLESMFEAGWLAEVQRLLDEGISPNAPALQAVGYREIVERLSRKTPLAETKSLILIAHMQLAKKQRTWLRGMLNATSDARPK